MDFNTLKKLDAETIRIGILSYYENAKDLMQCAEILADRNKFGPASAMTVLSIEELIKGFATFLFFLGERIPENIDWAFKPNSESRSVHQARLKLASTLSFLIPKIGSAGLEQTIESMFNGKDYTPKVEFLHEKEISALFNQISDDALSHLSIDKIGISENTVTEIEYNLKEPTNWFLHAKSHKENGIYAGYQNNSWQLPSHVTKLQYEQAKEQATQLFDTLSNLFEAAQPKNKYLMDFLTIFVGKYLDQREELGF